MRKIIVDLNVVKDNEFSVMYEMFGLDVQNKSYEDFERRLLQMSIETIIEVKNREQNLTSCAKWIFILEDIQQKSDCMYCIWWVKLVGINIQSDLNAIDSQVWGLLCY